jgi:hypothetical protein
MSDHEHPMTRLLALFYYDPLAEALREDPGYPVQDRPPVGPPWLAVAFLYSPGPR